MKSLEQKNSLQIIEQTSDVGKQSRNKLSGFTLGHIFSFVGRNDQKDLENFSLVCREWNLALQFFLSEDHEIDEEWNYESEATLFDENDNSSPPHLSKDTLSP
jgi:hypothetical protein